MYFVKQLEQERGSRLSWIFEGLCHDLTLTSNKAPHICSFGPSQIWVENKDSLTGKAKVMHASEAKVGIHSLFRLQAGLQPSLGKPGSITHNGDLGRQIPSF